MLHHSLNSGKRAPTPVGSSDCRAAVRAHATAYVRAELHWRANASAMRRCTCSARCEWHRLGPCIQARPCPHADKPGRAPQHAGRVVQARPSAWPSIAWPGPIRTASRDAGTMQSAFCAARRRPGLLAARSSESACPPQHAARNMLSTLRYPPPTSSVRARCSASDSAAAAAARATSAAAASPARNCTEAHRRVAHSALRIARAQRCR